MAETLLPDDDETYLCWSCVGESFLRNQIRRKGHLAICAFCSEECEALPLERVADSFEFAFKNHYRRTRTDPTDMEEAMYRHGISTDSWYRDGEPVIDAFESAGQLSSEIARAIQEILEARYGSRDYYEMQFESEFDSESYYEESGAGAGDWHELWSAFVTELMGSSRYFSNRAQETLGAVFDGIDIHRTRNDEPVIVEAGPDKRINALFRARVFHNREQVDKALEQPDSQIGPPPARLATGGRMNAAGIAVFYGALEKHTARSEVRPIVGSTVVVGKFRLLRDLRLLDLTSLSEVHVRGSIFDPEYLRQIQRAKFLGVLSSRMVAPVMPSDEAFDYLPTQVVCDYLAGHKGLSIDGIIYESVQSADGSRNVVLFHRSSLVEKIAVPDGAKVSASMSQLSDDEEDIGYQVTITLPAESDALLKPALNDLNFAQRYAREIRDVGKAPEDRRVTLSLDLESLEVQKVNAVSFRTQDFKVTHHTMSDRLLKKMAPSLHDLDADYSDLL